MTRVALTSLGCAKNLVDSEVMTGCLHKAGYRFTDQINQADVLIINTCGFIQPARDEGDQRIQEAVSVKKKRPGVKIIVAGCYVQRNRDDLEQKFPEVDIWTGVTSFDRIVDILQGETAKKSAESFLYDHSTPRKISTSSFWAYTKISEGCSHRCSFCSIPLIKGRYRSRKASSIIQEVTDLACSGIREINLISHDTTFYGNDLGMKNGLVLLLKKLVDIQALEWIRILYGYPEEITEGLLEIMQEDKVCSYLDLPFQHSSPRILKAMKRKISGREAISLLENIRAKLPDIALRTSLIVGFPGETKDEFEDLLDFVQEAGFDHLGVFVYSPEKGTACDHLGDPVPEDVKMYRKDRIMKLQAEISLGKNQSLAGQSLDVLIEGELKDDPTVLVGRTRFQAPEVDGLVFVDSGDKRAVLKNPIRKVEITGGDVYDLYGEFRV